MRFIVKRDFQNTYFSDLSKKKKKIYFVPYSRTHLMPGFYDTDGNNNVSSTGGNIYIGKDGAVTRCTVNVCCDVPDCRDRGHRVGDTTHMLLTRP